MVGNRATGELVGGLDESSVLPESLASAVPMASPATAAPTTTATSLPSSLYGVLLWARRGAPSGRRLRNGGLTSASAQQLIDRGLEKVQHRPRAEPRRIKAATTAPVITHVAQSMLPCRLHAAADEHERDRPQQDLHV